MNKIRANNTKHLKDSRNSIAMHKEANFRYIYGNPDGYAVFDGGKYGGYLIQSIKKIFIKPETLKNNLDEIIPQIRMKVEQKTGRYSIQHVQDIVNCNFRIFFDKKIDEM